MGDIIPGAAAGGSPRTSPKKVQMTLVLKTTESFRAGCMTLPGRYYTCSELFAREQERLVATRWHCAGRVEQIGEPGQYFLQEIGGESIIVLRDRQGVL